MTDQELETVHEWERMEGKELFDAECIETTCGFANGKETKS